MTGKHTKISQHVKARWRHRSAQAHQQVFGLEHEPAAAVFPGFLEPEWTRWTESTEVHGRRAPRAEAPQALVNRSGRSPACWTESTEVDGRRASASRSAGGASELEQQAAVGPRAEPLFCDRGPCDVTAKSLELSSVATVDALPSVQVDAAHLSDGLFGQVRSRRLFGVTRHQPERGLPRALTPDSNTLSSSIVTSSERRVRELNRSGRSPARWTESTEVDGRRALRAEAPEALVKLGRLGVAGLVEAAPVLFENALKTACDAASDVGGFGAGRSGQSMKNQREVVAGAEVVADALSKSVVAGAWRRPQELHDLATRLAIDQISKL